MIRLDKKKLTPFALVTIFFLMLGLSFAAVPLYDLFAESQDLAERLKMLQIKKYQK